MEQNSEFNSIISGQECGGIVGKNNGKIIGSRNAAIVTGSLLVGIGLTPSNGTTSYLSPTFEVTEDVFETTVDGVKMVFQLTPDTESPAEMNTYLPDYKALWMA